MAHFQVDHFIKFDSFFATEGLWFRYCSVSKTTLSQDLWRREDLS